MAVKYAARWRPMIYRSTIETVTQGTARVQTLQLCVYDDTKVGTAGNPYKPGDPATEQQLAIVTEMPIMLDVSAFAGLTAAQSQALWDHARDQQIAAWKAQPDILSYVNAAVGGFLSGLVVLG